eukprot:CAMPEP_0202887736 /NCGR_PEP_ID=MMETSP1391-20130828/42836_1 /ASSEMBLY_ACC=CAM_ASM_000867 /TAXON_ID=1034604 /ORGANISM="Chlamydomonas leiostraca, Strain SAG 11-49" /LENGTH=1357 /DNA_ID=CAMNT_0049571033 /DNA_START=127 /DNA_END=4200 /DNA_ORIENTATION=-
MVAATELGAVGAFAYAAWQVAGGWYRHKAGGRKRAQRAEVFEALPAALKQATEQGVRKAGDFGRALADSGNGGVVAGWERLPPDARIALVEELLALAAATGQLGHMKAVRQGRTKWAQLSDVERLELLCALDGGLRGDVGAAAKAEGATLAQSWLWQVTEPVPLLAEEPVRGEPAAAQAGALCKAVDAADGAVKDVLDGARKAQLAGLQAALGPINVAAAAKSIDTLKAACGELGLSRASADKAGGALLRALLGAALAADGALRPASVVAQAAQAEADKALAAEVEGVVATAREAKTAAIEAAARGVEVSHIVSVATGASQWSASAPLALKLALAELVLAQLAGAEAKGEGVVAGDLAAAAKKVVPLLPLPAGDEELAAKVKDMTAALGGGEGSTPAELAQLLAAALEGQLPTDSREPAATPEHAVVRQVVSAIFTRVATAHARPGAPLLGASWAIDRAEVGAAVAGEGARRAALHRTSALEAMAKELEAVRANALPELLRAKLAALLGEGEEGEAAATSLGRLALVTAFLREVALPGPDAALGGAVSRALSALSADEDVNALGAGGAQAQAVAGARALAAQAALASDVAARLELGPGAVALLGRIDAGLEALPATTDAANAAIRALAPPPAPAAAAAEGEEGAEGEGEGEAKPVEDAFPAPDAAKVAAARALVSALLGDGVVLLELGQADARRLAVLRDAVEGCVGAGSDGVVLNRHVTALKEVAGQLGGILAALDAKIAETSDEVRAGKLRAMREAAVSAGAKLQEFLGLEGSTRPGVLGDLTALRDLAYGIKVERKSAGLESCLIRLESAKGKAASVMAAISRLPGAEDAASELMVAEEGCERLGAQLRAYAGYVRLREVALGAQPASAGTAEEGADIELLPGDELAAVHEDSGVSFIDLYATPAKEGEEEEEEGGKEGEDDEDEEIETKTEEWRGAGHKAIARGRVAVVLLAGALEDGVVRATQDAGLPSTKSPLQLFAERLVASQRLAAEGVAGPGAGVATPLDWYIAAAAASVAPLKAFLQDNAFFGLSPGQVHVFAADGHLPALSEDLQLVLEGPAKLARSPRSSGDVWSALRAAGLMRRLLASGVAGVEVHALEDNLAARPADPVFIGACVDRGLGAAAKVADPEALLPVYEAYAPLVATRDMAAAFGRLVPALGTYWFSAPFLRDVDALLAERPLALCRLTPLAGITQRGPPAGAKVAGYALSRALTDWVAHSGELLEHEHARAAVFVAADEEFAPVWGAPPFFTPDTPGAAAEQLLLLHSEWVAAAGGALADEEEGAVEVAPCVSYAGEGLEALCEGRVFEDSYDLDLQGYAPRPAAKVVLPSPALLGPLALAWVGLAVARLAAGKK